MNLPIYKKNDKEFVLSDIASNYANKVKNGMELGEFLRHMNSKSDNTNLACIVRSHNILVFLKDLPITVMGGRYYNADSSFHSPYLQVKIDELSFVRLSS